MSETPDFTPSTPEAPAPTQAPPAAGFFDSIRRIGIVRSNDRWIAGVGSGVARRFNVDPLVVRAIFVVTLVFGGFGLILYGLAWALLPEESDGRIHLQELFRGNADVALLGSAGFLFAGLVAGDSWWSWWHWGWRDFPLFGLFSALLWLGLVGLVIGLIVASSRSGRSAGTAPAAPPAPTPVPYPTTTTAFATDASAAATSVGPVAAAAPAPAPAAWTPPPVPPAPPYGSWTPPPVPPVPPKPFVRGAGATMFGICAGLSLLAFAWLLLAERAGWFDGPVALTTVGISAVVFGLGVVVAGLRGRSSGVLGFVAIMLILFSVPLGIFQNGPRPPWHITDNNQGVGDITFVPTDVVEALGGSSTGAGNITVDLTQLDLPAGATEPVVVPVQVGAGQLNLVLPDGTSAAVDITVGMGSANWNLDGSSTTMSGFGLSRTVRTEQAIGGADLDLLVDVNVGLGEVSVTEATPLTTEVD